MFSEIKAFMELVEKATAWLDVALERAKRKRTRTAARILYDAGILVSGMRTYDNTYRPLLRRIRLLEPDASEAEREAILTKLEEWNSIFKISPRIRQALASLEAECQDADPSLGLDALLPCAEHFVRRMDSITKMKGQFGDQHELRRTVRSAKTKDELESAATFAEGQLELLDLDDLARADEAFGRLRRGILKNHDLPSPDWAT